MNKVVHFEIPTDDTQRAIKFYESTFGWKINNMPEVGYALAITTEVGDDQAPKEPGSINGGIMKRSDEIKSPVITIDVESIDEHAKKIEDAGGKIIRPKMPVFDMGFAAYFEDTEGNVIGLWENAKK